MFLVLLLISLKSNDQYQKTEDPIFGHLRGFLLNSWNSKYESKDNGESEARNLFQKIGKKIHGLLDQYALIIVTIGALYWLFLAWSIEFIDIAIASIISEMWLIVFVLVRYADKRKSNDKKILSKSIWILFILSLAGVIYITLSHTGVNQNFSYKGLLLLLVCVVLAAARVERSLKWAEQMSEKVPEWLDDKNIKDSNTNRGEKERNRKKIFTLLCLAICNIFTIILIILGNIIWTFLGNAWSLSFVSTQIDLFGNKIAITNALSWVICIGGGFVTAMGTWSLRQGNLDTETLDINGIYYITPALSLVWLFPFGLIQLQRWDYFIVGALIILATSILIAVEDATGRLGFRWLIVSLWSTGLLIYFREKWIQWPWLANDTPWEWGLEAVDYYSLIVLSATIFILILSFRTTRLIERINKEGEQYTRMKHIIKNLHGYKEAYIENDPLVIYLNELAQFDTKTIGKTLKNFQKEIKERRNLKHGTHQHAEINKLELGFDLLHQSKRRGRYLAENLVLYIFALVTIMVTIGTRPVAASAWNALMIDVLAFLFSAAICFMTINLIDLRAYREKSTAELMNIEEKGERDKDTINQKAVQVISIILAAVISTSFVVLLYDKWMGIWFL